MQNQRQKRLYNKYKQEYMNAYMQSHNEIAMIRYNDHFTMVPPSPGLSGDSNMWSAYPGSKQSGYSDRMIRSPSVFILPSGDEEFTSDAYISSRECSNCCRCDDDSGRFSSLCCSEYIFNGGQHLDDRECVPDGYVCYSDEEWCPDAFVACQ